MFRVGPSLLTCLLASASMPAVFAQAGDTPRAILETAPSRLKPVVVTGTRTERLLDDVPVRTQVIDSATMQRQQARDLADALRLLPGVYLRTIHGKQGQEVWMQGLDSDRVLVLIDGIPAIASTGSTVDLTQIMVADVERIEMAARGISRAPRSQPSRLSAGSAGWLHPRRNRVACRHRDQRCRWRRQNSPLA